MNEETILDAITPLKRRRDLLPVWIKIFIWMFLIFGILVPVALVFIILNKDFELSLYGLDTTNPKSSTGLLLIAVFILKFITAFGLWTEKKWAVMLAKIDAISGIILSGIVMIILPFFAKEGGFTLNLRLELIALIPYLIKMNKLKSEWEK